MTRLWRTGWLLLLIPPLLWSGNFVLARGMRADVPPVALAFWRWAGAFVFCLPFAWPHLRRDVPVLARHWVNTLLLAATGIAAFNTMIYIGLHGTTALNAVLLQSAMPLFILLWAILLFREVPGPRETLGILVSMGGVAVIAGHGSIEALAGLRFNPGDIWVVGAVIAYAFYSALLRRRPAVHPMSFLAVTFVLGAAMLVPLYLAELRAGHHIVIGVPALLTLLYVAIFPSLIAYLAFNRGVDLVGAGRAGQFVHLMQVFGTLLAVIFLGESLRPFHAAGIGLIAVGLYLANRRARA
jgi:drug/metabolite transporter (DMT)-like permease